MSLQKFKKNLRKLISANDMPYTEVARKSETALTQIHVYINPKKNVSPNATTLERLADALGVTMDELYRGDL